MRKAPILVFAVILLALLGPMVLREFLIERRNAVRPSVWEAVESVDDYTLVVRGRWGGKYAIAAISYEGLGDTRFAFGEFPYSELLYLLTLYNEYAPTTPYWCDKLKDYIEERVQRNFLFRNLVPWYLFEDDCRPLADMFNNKPSWLASLALISQALHDATMDRIDEAGWILNAVVVDWSNITGYTVAVTDRDEVAWLAERLRSIIDSNKIVVFARPTLKFLQPENLEYLEQHRIPLIMIDDYAIGEGITNPESFANLYYFSTKVYGAKGRFECYTFLVIVEGKPVYVNADSICREEVRNLPGAVWGNKTLIEVLESLPTT